MLVELAVARALTGRQNVSAQSREITRENATDVAAAVERGLQRVAPVGGADSTININLILNDRTVQEFTLRQDELRDSRRL